MGNLSERAMADALGLKKTTVREHKLNGMPMASAEDATDWLRKNVRVRKADLSRASAGAQAQALVTADIAAKPFADESQGVSFGAADEATPDFDREMLRQDERLVREARKQVEACMKSGDRVGFADALSSYSKLSKELNAARLRWLESERVAGRLLDLDEVNAAVTPHVAEVRRSFIKLGDRIAVKVNPGNPKHAKAVIDEAVDGIFAHFAGVDRALAKAYSPKTGEAEAGE